MEVKSTLNPGDKGTRNFVRKYGEKLIAVRYRYDKAKGMRYKTVELIEDELPWDPVLRYDPNRQVPIKTHYLENALRERVKAHGGYWNDKKKLWLLRYDMVLQLKLEKRMVVE